MAIKATIFKAQLNIADMDRSYYGDHTLTLARHPSENDERMMVRLLAFALNASETLAFTRGISTDDEPDLWQKNLNDEIELWIELGQPDEKRIRKACARATQVIIYTYQPRSAPLWWQQLEGKMERFDNLRVYHLPDDSASQLAALAARTMQLQCTIQDGVAWFSDSSHNLTITPQKWK
jgi:uncharacterized protein YaeQ